MGPSFDGDDADRLPNAATESVANPRDDDEILAGAPPGWKSTQPDSRASATGRSGRPTVGPGFSPGHYDRDHPLEGDSRNRRVEEAGCGEHPRAKGGSSC